MDSKKLQKCNVHTKQQWLESVRLAREQYEAPEAAIIMENPLVRAMRHWLFHPPTATVDGENSDSELSDSDSDSD